MPILTDVSFRDLSPDKRPPRGDSSNHSSYRFAAPRGSGVALAAGRWHRRISRDLNYGLITACAPSCCAARLLRRLAERRRKTP
jgi:hypothetical protein